MGSLNPPVLPLKRDSLLKSSPQRPRSRFLILKKIDYLQWISALAVFIFFMFLFQLFLPLSTVNDDFLKQNIDEGLHDLFKEISTLDFGEDVKFVPTRLSTKFLREKGSNVSFGGSRTVTRFGNRKVQLALVFADLLDDPYQILMVTLAAALRGIGYEFEVYSLEDGPVHHIWRTIGVPVHIMDASDKSAIMIDWLNYDGVLVNSLAAKDVVSCLLQEPFKSVPLIWTVHEKSLATRAARYVSNGQAELIDDWKAIFNRATVVVFPNYALPMFYSAFDAGNYFVVPGTPSDFCKVDNPTIFHEENVRVNMNIGLNDFVVGIVGSEFLYKGIWLEHALVLKALSPLLAKFPDGDSSSPRLKIIILSQDLTDNYSAAMEEIASNLNYPRGTVKHVAIDEDSVVLGITDLVIYGSFLEELSFPDVLIKAMCLEKPIIAPDLSVIKKHVNDGVNGYLFSKENIKDLTRVMLQVVSEEKLSSLARNIVSTGKNTAKNMMVLESVEGHASLIENVMKLPSEVAYPRAILEIPSDAKTEWQWRLFEAIADHRYVNRTLRIHQFLDRVESQWNHTLKEESSGAIPANDTFVYSLWEEEKRNQMMKARRAREDDEVRDRSEQSRGTWEEVYKNAKKADRSKNDLHERDDGELERTGQPLCIYEPYFGQGSWPFLHNKSIYRGIGLSTKGRRPKKDDIDAPSRLALLNTPYYRDTLGDFGAFFAIANCIDRIHKNAWIGFSSWRATGRKESLSEKAVVALLEDIEAQKHGDVVYIWVRMDKDPRNPTQQDFWSFCDSINAGNCKFAYSEAFKKIYGIKNNSTVLPPMPVDGDTWSVMNSWAMPTKSFLEFVMFSRMFVDALDAQVYEEHRQSGLCYLSLLKDKNCYSRVLEMVVNVWAYHSARRMVYVNPNTGAMQEQHDLKKRAGKMWVKWFDYNTLKAMDEDLAEEADLDHDGRRWLWPLTGEVFWQGVYEKERIQSRKDKETKKQKTRAKIQRIKNRTHQKVIGKYVKPPPERETGKVTDTNHTVAAARLLR
ncbi:putative glycosyl transferase, family 1 [Helianthus debilis subsp. tardiflorus]